MQVDSKSPDADRERDENQKAEPKNQKRWLSRWLHRREHSKQKSPVLAASTIVRKPAKKEGTELSRKADDKQRGSFHPRVALALVIKAFLSTNWR